MREFKHNEITIVRATNGGFVIRAFAGRPVIATNWPDASVLARDLFAELREPEPTDAD